MLHYNYSSCTYIWMPSREPFIPPSPRPSITCISLTMAGHWWFWTRGCQCCPLCAVHAQCTQKDHILLSLQVKGAQKGHKWGWRVNGQWRLFRSAEQARENHPAVPERPEEHRYGVNGLHYHHNPFPCKLLRVTVQLSFLTMLFLGTHVHVSNLCLLYYTVISHMCKMRSHEFSIWYGLTPLPFVHCCVCTKS